jgi:eukaryotic-like serine/threonine-protein kinase
MMDVVAGRYRLVEQIATTGMSEVWRAHDLELDRPVALKLLGVGSQADPERFHREAQAAAGLSHPNICRLFDYGETDSRRYIVFELLGGGSLEDRLPAGQPLPDGETARIAGELASALAYAHSRGVVHRDVKPTNVLFDEDGNAKLADFGVARITGEPTLTEAGTVLGTAAYISPEQASGEPAGPAADVYAFGVILFRMLTGRLPFVSDSALELAAMHANQDPPPISSMRADAPPELERLAMRALAKRPEDRPADGSALLAALTPAVEAETHILRPIGRRRLGSRHVAAGVGLAALALAGVAVAILAAPEESKAPVTGTDRQSSGRTGTTGRQTTATTAPTTGTTATTATTAPTTGRRQTTAPAEPPPPPPPPNPPTTLPLTTESLPTDTSTVTLPTDTITVGTTAP